MARLYPYVTLFRNPKLLIGREGVELSRMDNLADPIYLPEENFNDNSRIITLWPRSDQPWENVKLRMRADLSRTGLDRIEGNTAVTAVAECKASQVRTAIQLHETGDSQWQGELNIGRRMFTGLATLRCIVSETDSRNTPRFIGETETWKIYFEEFIPRIPYGAVRSIWIHFRTDSERPFLRDYASETSYLDLGGPEPLILLNSDFRGLRSLLEEPPRLAGRRKAVAIPTALNIAKSVYMSLVFTALNELGANAEGDEPDWPTTPWMNNILQMILPHIYPDLDNDAMLVEAYRAFQAGDMRKDISEASAVISRKLLKEGRQLGQALRAIDLNID